MAEDNFRELRRKLFHITLGSVLAFLFWQDIIDAWRLYGILFAGAVISAVFTYRRVPFIAWFLDRFDRPEVVPGRGALTFLAGFTVSAALFEKNIALACMLLLTFGDGIAGIVGHYFGRRKIPFTGKTIEGSVAFLLAAFLSCWPVVGAVNAYAFAIAGMVAELIPFPKRRIWQRLLLDDNIVVPLAAGIATSFVF